MKRIIKITLCTILAVLAIFLTESVVLADGSETPVYTVSRCEEGYALVSGGVSIAEGDRLATLLDLIPDGGTCEIYFDKVSTDEDITLYGGTLALTGVLTFRGNASLTVDGGEVKISGASVAFESGNLRVKRGSLTLFGGSVTSGKVAILSDFSASASVRVIGGSISSDTSSAIVVERGSISVSGGTVRGADSAIVAYTTLTLSGAPTFSGSEYDIVTDTEPTLFSDGGVYRGVARIKLLSDFPEGRATVAVYARTPDSLVGITLFDIDGICHPLHFLDKSESGVGESVGAVLRPYRITFYHGDDVLLKSDYIKGSEVEIPKTPEVLGYTFSGWYTDDGEPFDFNTDLHSDISLYASFTLTAPTYTLISPSFVYDGGIRYIELRDLYHPLISEGFLSYEWYKDGLPLNSFGETHPVRTVADSGGYSVKITLTVGKSSVSVTSPTADVLVSRHTVEIPNIPSVKYSGSPISPSLADTREYTVGDVVGTPVGIYPVAITLRDSENYAFEGTSDATVYVDFVIEKGINEWTQPLTVSDIYEGESLTPLVSALFGSVEILYRRVGETQFALGIPTKSGEYEARAFVVGCENYTALEGETVRFKIIAERVVGISVTKRPNKDTYSAFEVISPEGIEVLAMYNSSRLESVAVESLTFIYQSANSFRYGDSGITVSFGGVNVTLPLTVEKAEYDMSAVEFSAVSVVYRGSLITLPVPENLPTGLDGIPLVGTVRGGGTAVGEYPITLEFSTDSRNYRLPESLYTTLTVTPYACEAVWGDLSFTYDGTEKLPTAFYLDVFGRRVSTTVKGSRSLAGEYTATLSWTDTNYIITNPTVTFVIGKADYDTSGVIWCGGGEVYDGEEKGVYVTSLPDGVSVIGYVNNRATESGTYIARVSLSYDSANYNPPTVEEYGWQILKRDYETDGFYFADAEYVFDKMPHYPTLVGDMPVGIDGVRLEYEFSHGVVNVREGRATVNIIFKTASKNYAPPKPLTATVTVLPREITVLWSGLSVTYSGSYARPTATSSESCITVTGGGVLAGEYSLVATADDPNYKVVNSSAILVIHKAENKWIVTPTVDDIFYGRDPSPRAEARAGGVTYTYYSVSDPETPLRDVPRAVGDYTVIASTVGDGNYLPITSEHLSFSIIAVVPVSLDIKPTNGSFCAFEELNGDNITAYLSYNDGTRERLDVDRLGIEYPRAEHLLFGDSEVEITYSDFTVILPVTVKRADFDLTSLRWESTATVYDGSFKCAYLSGLPEGLSVLEYVGGGSDAGEYRISVLLSYDEENYNNPIIPDATLTVSKRIIPTPTVPPCEYSGERIVISDLTTDLYTATDTAGQYPGAYPILFTVRDAKNYSFESGESVSVNFVINPRKITLKIMSIEVGIFERAPDFSFEIISGSLLSGDTLSPAFSVKDGKISASVDMPNYDITVIEGEYIKTFKISSLTALIIFLIFLILLTVAVVLVLLVRRTKSALNTRALIVAIGRDLNEENDTKEEISNENKGQNENNSDINIPNPITSDYANELISNSLAKDLIRREVTVLTDGWRKGIVNVDTLSESFSAGERVDVNILKSKSLIPYDTAYIKVLARGVIDKPLHVYANDFSLSAVKMIALAGGRSIKVSTEIEKKEKLD